jgi:NhaP-type Na+/H+ or K+/H+ antiporter
MDEATLFALALVIFGWAIVSDRLAARDLTGPLVFLVAGFVLGNSSWGIVSVDVESSTVHHLAELTLGLLLFADASTVQLAAARRDLRLTSRLLGVGLPLSILAGTAVAVVLFPSLPVALAGLIGASLAPTDAALSASVITDERLPIRVRRVLNVESGMNDGIATPVVTFCIAAAATTLGVVQHSYDDGLGALGELAIGVAVGSGVALVGGRLVHVAHRRGWTQEGSRRLATLALALICFIAASEAGGNPFVAAFIGGLIFGAAAPTDAKESTELTEMLGGLLSLVLWFVFGAGFVLPALENLDARIALYAVLSLTVVRMIPVAISLLGSGQDRARPRSWVGSAPAGWRRWCSHSSRLKTWAVPTPGS